MALVRLQCPTCAVIVKISQEVAAQHLVVRCAQCQGLVHVETCQVSGSSTELTTEKPRKKKRRPASAMPIGMIVGVLLGLMALAGLGVGIYFLVDHFTGGGPEKSMKQGIALMERLVKTLDGIKTPIDVQPGMDSMMSILKELNEVKERNRQSQAKYDAKELQNILESYLPKMLELQNRLNMAMMRIMQSPDLAKAFQEYADSRGTDMMGTFRNSLATEGVSASPFKTPRPAPSDSPGRAPPVITNPPSNAVSSNNKLQELENLLIHKGTQALFIPSVLADIRDGSTADQGYSILDGIVQNLQSNETKIKQLISENVSPTSKTATDAIRNIQKAMGEIQIHLQRLEKLPDVTQVHRKILKRLEEVGLAAPVTPSSASGGADANPFESAGNSSKGTAESPSKNPFETVRPGTPANSSSGGNRSGNAPLDSTLGKLTSSEFFKKQEGLRELNTAKVDEASKKQVLDALITLLDDSEVHQKNDVFKLCRKWATTQEDKELLGQHADTLMKDHWAKKDALRYFSENKVASASKELARLLKDNFERKEAAETLIAIGSGAEKSVMPYVTDLEPQVRQMAIEVLARIGTKESIPELQKVQNDRYVGNAAKQAIRLILARKKD